MWTQTLPDAGEEFDSGLQWQFLLEAAWQHRGKVLQDRCQVLSGPQGAHIMKEQVAAMHGLGVHHPEDPLNWLDRTLFQSTLDAIMASIEWREIVSVINNGLNDTITIVALPPPAAVPNTLTGLAAVPGTLTGPAAAAAPAAAWQDHDRSDMQSEYSRVSSSRPNNQKGPAKVAKLLEKQKERALSKGFQWVASIRLR